MHAITAKAVAFFEAMQPEFVTYQKAVLENGAALAAELQQHGLRLVTGGTDNHLVLIDLTPTGITGRAATEALEAAGIVASKNLVPFDPRPPTVTSGVRIGTPAVTTRGFGTAEMKIIASLITRVLTNIDDDNVHKEVAEQVASLCTRFPTPGIDA